VAEYGVFTRPLGSEVVVIVRGTREMVRVRATVFVDAGLLESVTMNVSGVLVTTTVGVPEIVPADEFRDNPAGRAPELRDQVYGALPPCAVKVAE
jgi:hypothetical protein